MCYNKLITSLVVCSFLASDIAFALEPNSALRVYTKLGNQDFREDFTDVVDVCMPSPAASGAVVPEREKIYYFSSNGADGNVENMDILGAKGANLAEMAKMGLPVPPGFTITAVSANKIIDESGYFGKFKPVLAQSIRRLEQETGRKLGDGSHPLFLSARGGAEVSMPGLLKTVTNIGFNDKTVEVLAGESGDAKFAYESYALFIIEYAREVMDVDISRIITRDSASFRDLSLGELKELVVSLKKEIKRVTRLDIPDDPYKQLYASIETVIKSWRQDAVQKRLVGENETGCLGTAVNVQMMVFGNGGEKSATGVAFSRNPINGEKESYGEVMFNSQGKSIVGGKTTPENLRELDARMPNAAGALRAYLARLEKHFGILQDVEFTIDNGRLYILQTRENESKTTSLARARILMDMMLEGEIPEYDAYGRIGADTLETLKKYLEAPVFRGRVEMTTLAEGIPVSPGIRDGRACFSMEDITSMSTGDPKIFVAEDLGNLDEEAAKLACGTLTQKGGASSHAALDYRESPETKPFISGIEGMFFTTGGVRFGDTFVNKGDWITLDGNTGRVLLGKIRDDDLEDSEVSKVLKGVLDGDRSALYKYYKIALLWKERKEAEKKQILSKWPAVIFSGTKDRQLAKKAGRLLKIKKLIRTRWRQYMSYATASLFASGTADNSDKDAMDKMMKERLGILELLYLENRYALAHILHAQGANYAEAEELFSDFGINAPEFSAALVNLMGQLNIKDLPDDEREDYTVYENYLLIRILFRILYDYRFMPFLSNLSPDTIKSIIEEGYAARDVDGLKDKARLVCGRISEFLVNKGEIPGLSQDTAVWFKSFVDEKASERAAKTTDDIKLRRLRELDTSGVLSRRSTYDDFPDRIQEEVEMWVKRFTNKSIGVFLSEDEVRSTVRQFSEEYLRSNTTQSKSEDLRYCLEMADSGYVNWAAMSDIIIFSYFSEDTDRAKTIELMKAVSPRLVARLISQIGNIDKWNGPIARHILGEDYEGKRREFVGDIMSSQPRARYDKIRYYLDSQTIKNYDLGQNTVPVVSAAGLEPAGPAPDGDCLARLHEVERLS